VKLCLFSPEYRKTLVESGLYSYFCPDSFTLLKYLK